MSRGIHTNSNCQCSFCKAKRGELSGKNHFKWIEKVEWTCPVCGTVKILTPYKAKKRHFCSRDCYYKTKRSEEANEKNRQATLKQFKDGMPQETKDKIKKNHADQSGDKNPMFGKGYKLAGTNHYNWKGGEFQQENGERWIIWADGVRYRRAQYVAMQYLGRELSSKEIVHHINKNPSDDRPENLYVFVSTGKHLSHHRMKNPPILKSNLFERYDKLQSIINLLKSIIKQK